MPLSAQAIKKMRHDKTVTQRNRKVEDTVRAAIKSMRKSPSPKALTKAFSLVDKAVKTQIFHRNKADRLKARLSKLLVK